MEWKYTLEVVLNKRPTRFNILSAEGTLDS